MHDGEREGFKGVVLKYLYTGFYRGLSHRFAEIRK